MRSKIIQKKNMVITLIEAKTTDAKIDKSAIKYDSVRLRRRKTGL